VQSRTKRALDAAAIDALARRVLGAGLVENGPRQYPEAEYARIRDGATEGLLRALGRL
jgi:hypothetical protein